MDRGAVYPPNQCGVRVCFWPKAEIPEPYVGPFLPLLYRDNRPVAFATNGFVTRLRLSY